MQCFHILLELRRIERRTTAVNITGIQVEMYRSGTVAIVFCKGNINHIPRL
ncbi:Uncharacterised protein [Vibrio cholerae]|nr:Uncharacterised protein [Vibrio cholerae]